MVIDMSAAPLAWVCLGLWLQLWAAASLQKCIFDDVQSLVKVVAPPLGESPPPPLALPHTPLTGPKSAPPPHLAPPAGKAPPPPANKRAYRQLAPPTQTPGRSIWPTPLPIRIKTWIPKESPALSRMERERLEPAVTDAVNTVSRVLSGKATCECVCMFCA